MSIRISRRQLMKSSGLGFASLVLPSLFTSSASAGVAAIRQSIAEKVARDKVLSDFYRGREFQPLFVDGRGKSRRKALLQSLSKAHLHGLPVERYDLSGLEQLLKTSKTADDLGTVEVALAKNFLSFANHMRSGVVEPRSVDSTMYVKVAQFDQRETLEAFSKSSPSAFMRRLTPSSPSYQRLQKELLRLQKIQAQGGWGPKVKGKSVKPDAASSAIVSLRNRLIRMGYLRNSSSASYNVALKKAVQNFQIDHGLSPDGVAGAATLKAINTPVSARLSQVVVGLERERWRRYLKPAKREVIVNIPDFHVDLYQNGKSIFRSRVVVGANTSDRRTPEFSDRMEHMVINPSWYVPRSIVTKEYLPILQKNPNGVRHLQILGSSGRPIDRSGVDFSQYTASNFPYAMKQAPSKSNALGLVKFMFPNRHNIYLHDTPAKNLFGREARAYSHGCIRVHKPFEFAYTLLGPQKSDPKGFFQGVLRTGAERQVNLDETIPVHLIYQTAWVDNKGRAQYRNDIYGRDNRIYAALKNAGVSIA